MFKDWKNDQEEDKYKPSWSEGLITLTLIIGYLLLLIGIFLLLFCPLYFI